jgi:hypothetical protein
VLEAPNARTYDLRIEEVAALLRRAADEAEGPKMRTAKVSYY